MLDQLALHEQADPEIEALLARMAVCPIHIGTTLDDPNTPCPMCDLDDIHQLRRRLLNARRGNQSTAKIQDAIDTIAARIPFPLENESIR